MNLLYQPIWKDKKSIFAYSAEFDFPNPYALLLLGKVNLSEGNYEDILKLSDRLYAFSKCDKLDELNRSYALTNAIFLQAVFLSYSKQDKKEALKLCLIIKPYISSKQEEYPLLMDTIGNCYFAEGNIKMAAATINDVLASKSLDDFLRDYFCFIKEHYLGNYDKAIYYLEICHKMRPDDKNIINRIERNKVLLRARNNFKTES
jgi:tetratricopeptide (TPR) repeat protein